MVAPIFNESDEGAQRILDAIDNMSTAQSLTDAQLSEALIHIQLKVCPYGHSIDYWVLNELMNRFDKLAGIKRDAETGEIIT